MLLLRGCMGALGQDNAVDAARTAEIFRAGQRHGAAAPALSIDSNEGNPDAAAVLDYLERLEQLDAEAYAALGYLEQPTARDIVAHSFNWRELSRRKPVYLDEGLTSLELLALAREQHWSGFALKICKSHSVALVAAAWAAQNGMTLTLQDLTNSGYSAIHAFLFGAHLPLRRGVEINSPQYTPAANEPWLPRLGGVFAISDGKHRLDAVECNGLGSAL